MPSKDEGFNLSEDFVVREFVFAGCFEVGFH